MLSAALQSDVPIIALHLTRPPIEIPDRAKLGMASHFEAARGAYLLRDYRPGLPRMGTLFVQGTSTTLNVTRILPQLDQRQLNVKIVAAVSYELFLRQPESYRTSLVSEAEWIDSTVITNAARRSMHNWLAHPIAEKYAMSSDWDNRWRTGGTVDEVLDEARLTPDWILRGIDRFVRDRRARLDHLGKAISDALEG
jgi:transketolase